MGRYLKPNEVIHHINGNITDNRLVNLLLMNNSTHMQYHIGKYWKEKRDKCFTMQGKPLLKEKGEK